VQIISKQDGSLDGSLQQLNITQLDKYAPHHSTSLSILVKPHKVVVWQTATSLMFLMSTMPTYNQSARPKIHGLEKQLIAFLLSKRKKQDEVVL
jgi:hypothetical protein